MKKRYWVQVNNVNVKEISCKRIGITYNELEKINPKKCVGSVEETSRSVIRDSGFTRKREVPIRE